MTVVLENIVPWGRTMAEYVEMFKLTETDLHGSILGCGDGPASFNSEMTQRGYQVVSVDPIYQFPAAQIEERVTEVYPIMMEQVMANRDTFVWNAIPSPEALGALRMGAMKKFLADYEQGKTEGRYLPEALPNLPFSVNAFELALCSHCLFLYSDHFSLAFHQEAIAAMCRVAREVRIFPLLALDGKTSRHLEPIMTMFQAQGYYLDIEQTDYEFQRGGNQFLRIRHQ